MDVYWITADELPRINETILLTDCTDVHSGYLDSNLEWRFSDNELASDYQFDVFYWMYFPEPPKENQNENS